MEKQIKLSAEEYAEHVEIDGLLSFILELEDKALKDAERASGPRTLQTKIFNELTDKKLLQLLARIAELIEDGKKQYAELLKKIIFLFIKRKGWDEGLMRL